MMPIIEERKPFRKEGQGDEYEFQAERSGKQSPFRKQPFCRRKSCGKSCHGDAKALKARRTPLKHRLLLRKKTPLKIRKAKIRETGFRAAEFRETRLGMKSGTRELRTVESRTARSLPEATAALTGPHRRIRLLLLLSPPVKAPRRAWSSLSRLFPLCWCLC